MKELMKKVLTDKKARNMMVMAAFVMSIVVAEPWQQVVQQFKYLRVVKARKKERIIVVGDYFAWNYFSFLGCGFG